MRGYELAMDDGAARVRGRVDVHSAPALLDDLSRAAADRAGDVDVDLSGVDYFDSSGAAVLLLVRRRLQRSGRALRVVSSRPEIDHLLALIDADAVRPPRAEADAPLVRRIAATLRHHRARTREGVVFAGEVTLGLLDAVRHPRRVRWREMLVEIQRAGADSLPIVALISFLVGVITAFQGKVAMRDVGTDLYVPNLVGFTLLRELGPLMTAIIASGRSGASYAAELGTMKVSEEIDALVTMGLDRARFLITPKVVALVLMLPCLTVFADVIGMMGGILITQIQLELAPEAFLRQAQLALQTNDFLSGLFKSVVFGVIVAFVGCLRGLQAAGGAESVGQATTSAVVTSLTLIVAADAVFAVIYSYHGI